MTIGIILGSVVLAVVLLLVAGIVVVAIWEAVQDRRFSAHLDDVEAHMAPLRTGSRSAERAMLRFHREHGLLLLRRTSEATRRFVHAVDGARRPGWMLRHRLRPMRRPVFGIAPAELPEISYAPPLEALPEGGTPPELHDAPVVDGPELLTAPLPEVDFRGLTDATALGLLVSDPGLPPAPDPGGASPIGDALTAEMGIVPQPCDGAGEHDSLAWIDAWLASPLPGDAPNPAADSGIYPDWQPDDSGIMRAIRGEAV